MTGLHAVIFRHITATNFFVEPVDSPVRELLVIDRLTNEITLTSKNCEFMQLSLLTRQECSGVFCIIPVICYQFSYTGHVHASLCVNLTLAE